MQVNQVNDFVTHAVIGGQKAINFTVSDDAELMNVLSKALYTDQQLAVVRETLCNAWDAHIEAGCTDKAIEISLSNEELIIRDFGHGIAQAMIGPVYGTYGGSTKKHDGKQTGGFGLGCKSPFAYTDHFEVTSWSAADGTMTVYNMSKSSAEVQGKPGIVPIVSVPTIDHGLQVRIKLKSPQDYNRFNQLIGRIVKNGEMNAIYNGQVLDTFPFGLMEKGYLITKETLIETPQSILLRYGHVIYPIEKSNEFADEYQRALKLLDRFGKDSYGRTTLYRVVFQAPANQISITPSREALSMQEGTIKTIKKLLENFVSISEEELKKGCFELLDRSIETVFLSNTPAVLLKNFQSIPNIPKAEAEAPVITSIKQLIVRAASASYPNYEGFRERDLDMRIKALLDFGFGDRKLIESFKSYVKDMRSGSFFMVDSKDEQGKPIKKRVEKDTPNEWLMKALIRPLILDLIKDPLLHHDKFFAYTRDRKYKYKGDLKVMPVKDIDDARNSAADYMPWLRKIVILAHNRLEFEWRAEQFPIMKFWLGEVEDVFLYTVARSPKKVEAARAFFEKQGFVILDLTVAQKWEAQDAAATIPKEYASRPRRKGLAMLASAMKKNADGVEIINMTWPNQEEEQLVEKPEFILKASFKSDTHHLPNQSAVVSKFIIRKWGQVGAFVVNQNQEAKYIAMGAATYEDFLLGKILEEVNTNPRIRASLSFMWSRNKTIMERKWGGYNYDRKHKFLEAVYADQDLKDYFGIVDTMIEEDRLFWLMWNEFLDEGRTGTKKLVGEIKKILEEFPTDPAVIDLFNQIRRSTLLLAFNPDVTCGIMTNNTDRKPTGTNSKHRQMLRDMLLEAIEAS